MMSYEVTIETVRPQFVAAVRARAVIGDIAQAWKPALDQVWAFLRSSAGVIPGHNLFLYHHPKHRNDPMEIDFGVQVSQAFEPAANVRCIETPAGEVASTVHVGPYDRLADAHNAIHTWCSRNNRKIGQASWEIYGDWTNDPARLETTIRYLLA
jgi:effector-binding domain-containing protein